MTDPEQNELDFTSNKKEEGKKKKDMPKKEKKNKKSVPAKMPAAKPGKGRKGETPDQPPMVEVRLDAGGDPVIASITAEAALALGLRPGMPVVALIKSAAFDRMSLGPAEAPSHAAPVDAFK